eukprot:s2744_g17.t1
MKITVRPIKGESFFVEVPETDTIESLKQAIAAASAEHPQSRQKLLHNGRVLDDSALVSTYGITEKEFVVVFLTKSEPKPCLDKTSSTEIHQVQPVQPAVETPAEASAANSSSATSGSSGSRGPALPDTSTAAVPVEPAAGEEAAAQLCEMGFERAQVMECLRAACNDRQKAAEYLLSGGPPRARSRSPRRAPEASESSQPPAQPADDLEEEEEEEDEQSDVPLNDEVRQQQTQQIRDMLQNPEHLNAINRLEALGFGRTEVCTAYLVCDMKEEVAANYLFDMQGQ